jgi:MerR family transcriptional regulator, heat shock protein HspR
MTFPLDDELAAIYSVGQVAGMLGVQPAFVRRLDVEQVVQPARSEGNQRRYSRDDIERVSEVMSLVDEGLTLTGVRRVLELQAEVDALRAEVKALRRRRS